MLSLHGDGNEKIVNVANETRNAFDGAVSVAVKNNKFDVLTSYRTEISVSALSAKDIVLPPEISEILDKSATELFLEYTLEKDGEILERDGKIYAKPSEYHFENPEITFKVREEDGVFYLDIKASRFAKNIMIEWENAEVIPEDNFFDITNGTASVLLSGKREDILSEMPKILSVYDVQY
jgi:hypothetical protein